MTVDLAGPSAGDGLIAALPAWTRLRRAFRHRSLLIGSIIVAVILILILAAPLLTSASPITQHPMETFLKPSASHPFGTDSFGRDMFSRVLHGGQYTLGASALVVLMGGTVGTLLGLIAGYFGGAAGYLIMRFVDLLLAFPGILLALAVAAILGPGLLNGVFAVAAVLVPAYARVVEGAVTEVRHLPYVDASAGLGSGAWHIIWHHILPGIRSNVIVMTTSWLGIAALWIAALGFIGLGVQPPTPEWGALLSDGQQYLTLAWWISVFPGIFLALFVVGVNLIGDGLRDELDPALSRF
jgi:ABC-type dipeptide/oligopeptide/nickel transport system permease subunit